MSDEWQEQSRTPISVRLKLTGLEIASQLEGQLASIESLKRNAQGFHYP